MAAYRRFTTHITCRLTAKNRDQLQNPTLGNRVWPTVIPARTVWDVHVEQLGRLSCTDALKMDGDEVMVDIYESVQDELRMKNKHLQKERQKVFIKFGFMCFYPPSRWRQVHNVFRLSVCRCVHTYMRQCPCRYTLRPVCCRLLVCDCSTFVLSKLHDQQIINTNSIMWWLSSYCGLCANVHTNTRLFNGPLSRTTWVSRYQKGKTNLALLK